jgi:6-phosphogluconolactonase (cycloisomerase 2 family)
LFVVNAGSNAVSMFAIEDDGSLTLLGTPADSAGTRPISVTEHAGVAYVLNAGDASHAPSITGFDASDTGLTSNAVSLTLSTLVASSASAAQLSFTPDGKHLIATEKGTGEIDSYEVDATGIATGPHSQLAAGGATATPYGFAFSGNGTLLVTEAAGAVSAYTISATGALTATTTSLSTHQAAPCWMAAGSDSVTGYNVAADGTLTLTKGTGIAAATANKPLDAALSSDGTFLYVLDSVDHAISTYAIAADGSLARRHDVIGLPATAVGLAAN